MTYTFETLIETIHDQLTAATETIDDERSPDHPTLTVASVDVTIPFDVEAADEPVDEADGMADGAPAGKRAGDGTSDAATCERDLAVVPGCGDGELTVSFRPSARRVAVDPERTPGRAHPTHPDSQPDSSGLDVRRVEGIGPATRDALRRSGITSLEVLAEADPDQVADATGISRKRATTFVTAARLQTLGADAQTAELLAARGLDEASLAAMDAASAVDELDAALDDRLAEVPSDYVPDVRRLDTLIRRAKTVASA